MVYVAHAFMMMSLCELTTAMEEVDFDVVELMDVQVLSHESQPSRDAQLNACLQPCTNVFAHGRSQTRILRVPWLRLGKRLPLTPPG